MKRLFIIIFTCLALAAACNTAQKAPRSGDLLFVAIPADYTLSDDDMGSGIAAATGDSDGLNYIHVAILEVDPDTTWVIDATIRHGVARYPLETFLSDFTLKDGSLPRLEVMRIKNGARDLVKNAKTFIGEKYDVYFLPDNGVHYCTELVRDSYLDSDGNPVFENAPMNFKDVNGEFPVYWQQLFGLIGEPIPQGVEGTNPRDMRRSPLLEYVMDLQVDK